MLVLVSIWPATIEGWVGLIALLVGLIGSIAALVPTIIKLFKALKQIAKDKNLKKILELADAAMDEVEHSGTTGPEAKKELAISIVKRECEELGIELDVDALKSLSDYIEEAIAWFNSMKKKKGAKK